MPDKLTHEEFISKLHANNVHDIVVLGQYINSQTPIRAKCNAHNFEYSPLPADLLRGRGCKFCGIERSADSRRMTNSEFINKLNNLNKNIIALDKYSKYENKIRFQCEFGHVWSALAHHVLSGSGCPYCNGNKVWTGFNDLWTTRPDIAEMLKNPEDGYQYSCGSNTLAEFICPQCGSIATKKIVDVCNQRFGCQICSDGISYPNKFIRQVLIQLRVNFIPEYSPDWIKPRKYDCYFEYNGDKYIIEMDGRQHFCNAFSSEPLDKIQANDDLKNSLAQQNGINVIRIDCFQSDCVYIKTNILSSQLNNIFDLSNIDWNLCDQASQKSLVKSACDLYMSGVNNLVDICNSLHICVNTARNYLEIGAACGLCNYDPDEARRQMYTKKSISVILINNVGNILYRFNGLNDCVRRMQELFNVRINKAILKQHCQTRKPYKGFNFRFANETIQN